LHCLINKRMTSNPDDAWKGMEAAALQHLDVLNVILKGKECDQ
jgi:hypothetical protein